MITSRRLDPEEIVRAREIDRSERQKVRYRVAGGELIGEPFEFEVPSWVRDDPDHWFGMEKRIREWRRVLEAGAR